MHECWQCGQACDCDGEDTWYDNYEDCECECEEYFDALEDEDREYSEDYCDREAHF